MALETILLSALLVISPTEYKAYTYPPRVALADTQALIYDLSLFDPVYEHDTICEYLAEHGPTTDALKAIVEKDENPVDLRRLTLMLAGPSGPVMDVLIKRAETDKEARDYVINKQRYWALERNPKWLAEAIGPAAADFVKEELLFWSKEDKKQGSTQAILRLFRFASCLKTPLPPDLCTLLESYADGTIPNETVVQSAAAMLLVETNYKREHFEQMLKTQFEDMKNWTWEGDESSDFSVGFPRSSMALLKTRFFDVVSPQACLSIVDQLPERPAKITLAVFWIRQAAQDDEPAHNGVRFLIQLLELKSPDHADEFRLSEADRENLLHTYAVHADRSDVEGHRLIGQDWAQEKTPRLRFMRFMLLLYSGVIEATEEQYTALVDALSPDEKAQYAVTIEFGKAHFGDGAALRRMLDGMIGDKESSLDGLLPDLSLGDLITGTDYMSPFPGGRPSVFYQWALDNLEHLTYRPESHCWQYDEALNAELRRPAGITRLTPAGHGKVIFPNGEAARHVRVRIAYVHDDSGFASWVMDYRLTDREGNFRIYPMPHEMPAVALSWPVMRYYIVAVASSPEAGVGFAEMTSDPNRSYTIVLSKAKGYGLRMLDDNNRPLPDTDIAISRNQLDPWGIHGALSPVAQNGYDTLCALNFKARTDEDGNVGLPCLSVYGRYFWAWSSRYGLAYAELDDLKGSVLKFRADARIPTHITGRVLDKETGLPLSGMLVATPALWPVVSTAVTAADGSYSLTYYADALPRKEGAKQLLVAMDPDRSPEYGISQMPLPIGKREVTQDIFLGRGTEIVCHLTDSKTGLPVPDIGVSASSNKMYMYADAYGISDADGRVVFRLPGSEATLRLVAPSLGHTWTAPHPLLHIALPGRSVEARMSVKQSPETTVRLRVRTPDGAPEVGMQIMGWSEHINEPGGFSAVTDSEGIAEMVGMTPGKALSVYGVTEDFARGFFYDSIVPSSDEPIPLIDIISKECRRAAVQCVDEHNKSISAKLIIYPLGSQSHEWNLHVFEERIDPRSLHVVPGMLAGVEYVVEVIAQDGVHVLADSPGGWLKWKFDEDGNDPLLIVHLKK